MGNADKPWFMPTPEVLSGVCRFTRLLHRAIAVCGLLLGAGGGLVDLLQVTSDTLNLLGVVLAYALGFCLFAIAPLSLIALPVCRFNKQLVAQNLLVWIFIGVLWFFAEELDMLVTIVFLGYALVVLALWLKDDGGKRPA